MTSRSERTPRQRTVIALFAVVAVLAAFLVRLVDIQVVNADDHVGDAQAMGLAGERTLYGNRGSIVDADGTVLASSTQLYDAQIDPLLATSMERLSDDGKTKEIVPFADFAGEIAQVTGQDPADLEKIVSDALADNPESRFAYIKRGVSTAQYRELVELGLPFITFAPQPSRVYPNGAVGGNLLGFMSNDGEALAGYELLGDACLQGSNGRETYQQSPDGVRIPGTETVEPAQDGGTLEMTIDADLEWYLSEMIAEETQRMGALSGTVTVVEVATGKIRAAAEYPALDPNDVLASDPADRGSRIFTTTFEPGSTFKPITASMLLDQGAATPMSTVPAAGRETFPNGAAVGDPFSHETYNYTLAGALIDSSNVAMSKFGEKLPAQVRHDYLEKFGVGQRTAIGFQGEEPGVLHPAENWDNQTYYATNFGQGFTTTVPQVASAYQAIANGGLQQPLSLVESCTKADGTVVEPELPEPKQVISEQAAAETALMIENVAAQGSIAEQIEVPGYRIAAKTGTAQKPAEGGGYKAGVYFTSIVGFAPAEDPEYVVMVTLDEPTQVRSSAATAPAMQKAMTQVLKHYRVMPSTGEPHLFPKY